jgi:carbon-monoxide dehydrogenase medium subunit
MNLPLPELPAFRYVRATSKAHAVDLLEKHAGDARLLQGGTDLFVQMRAGDCQPGILVDIKQVPDLQQISFDPEQGLRLGPAVPMNRIAEHPEVNSHYPILVESIRTVASYQLRNRATVGGNICNASPAADTAPPLLVLEAMLSVAGMKGERKIPIGEFFTGPGTTALGSEEFLTSITLPVPPLGTCGCYDKLGRNASGDLAIVGVAILAFPDQAAEAGARFRIALASVAPTPIRARDAERILAQSPITEASMEAAAEAAQIAASPIDDLRASAGYRKAMVKELSLRSIKKVWGMLEGVN